MQTINKHLDELSTVLSPEIVKELLMIYFQQINESLPLFYNYTEIPDTTNASELAHKLKSSSNNVGAFSIGEIFQNIEKQPTEFLSKKYLEQISNHYETFYAESSNWMNTH